MYSLIAIVVFVVQITSAWSTEIESSQHTRQLIDQAIKDDLNGKTTCFQGRIKAFSENLQEDYGGRFSQQYHVYTTPLNSSIYRQLDKYCSDEENGKYVCISTNEENYFVAINFSASTTGTWETESITFLFTTNTTNRLVLNADDLEILTHDVDVAHSCRPIPLPAAHP